VGIVGADAQKVDILYSMLSSGLLGGGTLYVDL